MVQLETSKKLSESVIWELQQMAYSQFGPSAWTSQGVPFYLTSNPLAAKQFAHILAGYLKDSLSFLDTKEPFYIFDLGAGSGRLGFLILKHLLPLVRDTVSADLSICYVMTDMVEENLKSLEKHPSLQEAICAGNLDFALYHHTRKEPLELLRTKKSLQKTANPLALVCTYYFDTVPQDLFKARGGKLEEGRITLSLSGEEAGSDAASLDPEMIMKLEPAYDYTPVDNPEEYYTKRPEFNQLLLDYVRLFDDTPFLYPIGGLESLRYFSELSEGRLLLLAGDQGVSTERQVREWGEPKIFKHASFSMAVSYHLLAGYFRNQGGAGLLTSDPNPKYVVMAGILGGAPEEFSLTRVAFQQQIDSFEPVEYWELTNIPQDVLSELPLRHLILYIKLGNWDPVNFHLFFPEILKKLPEAAEDDKQFLQEAVYRVLDNFYPVSKQEGDFVMNLGVLLFEMKQFKEALTLFQRALELSGENQQILSNLAKCSSLLGDKESARKYFERSISIKAGNTFKE